MPAVFAYSVLWFLFVSQFFDRLVMTSATVSRPFNPDFSLRPA